MFRRLQPKDQEDSGSRAIINKFRKEKDVFISWEGFTTLPHKELFNLLNNEWHVLVTTRELEPMLESRVAHWRSLPDVLPGRFFLKQKILNNIIDQEVIDHYNPENLRKGIDNLTILSYEKLFGGDAEEIRRLCDFVECDISEIFLKNIDVVINGRDTYSKPGERRGQ